MWKTRRSCRLHGDRLMDKSVMKAVVMTVVPGQLVWVEEKVGAIATVVVVSQMEMDGIRKIGTVMVTEDKLNIFGCTQRVMAVVVAVAIGRLRLLPHGGRIEAMKIGLGIVVGAGRIAIAIGNGSALQILGLIGTAVVTSTIMDDIMARDKDDVMAEGAVILQAIEAVGDIVMVTIRVVIKVPTVELAGGERYHRHHRLRHVMFLEVCLLAT